jgi:hypothetical protein
LRLSLNIINSQNNMIDKQPILDSIKQSIDQSLASLNDDLAELLQERVEQIIQTSLESGLLNSQVERSIHNFLTTMVSDSYKQILLSRIVQSTDSFVSGTFANTLADTQQQISQRATEVIDGIVSTVDIAATIRAAIQQTLSDPAYVTHWPEKSIPSRVVDFNDSVISANVLHGGIARNFASSGIADFADSTQITVLNDRVMLHGNLQIDGNLALGGLVNTDSEFYRDLSQNLQQNAVERVENLVKQEIGAQLATTITDEINRGIGSEHVQFKNEPVVIDSKLNRFVTESNLQKVGRLRELDVGGEVSLNNTVRVVRRRLGINTIAPEAALDVWDQEVQIVAEKIGSQTGYIGLGRPGLLKLGVNRNNAITILPNGGVEIPDLRLGQFEKIAVMVSGAIPATAGNPGDIMFNSNPGGNGVFAWICLEGTRWAPVRLDM